LTLAVTGRWCQEGHFPIKRQKTTLTLSIKMGEWETTKKKRHTQGLVVKRKQR